MVKGARGSLTPLPLRRTLLGEGADALAEVLGGKAGPAQLDYFLLDLGSQTGLRFEYGPDDPFVSALGQGRVAGQLAGQSKGGLG
jgi:hypothetical protein